MIRRPFRPPLLRNSEHQKEPVNQESHEPLAKRKRIEGDSEIEGSQLEPRIVFKKPGISSLPRKPLLTLDNPAISSKTIQPSGAGSEGYYNVLWYHPNILPTSVHC